jgi:hypothetical protein
MEKKTITLGLMALMVLALVFSISNISAATTTNTTYVGPNGGSVIVTQTTGSNDYGSAVYYNAQTSYGGNYHLVVAQSNTGATAVGTVGYSPVLGMTYSAGGVQSSYGTYAGASTSNYDRTAYVGGVKNPAGNVYVTSGRIYH